jgi:hypothetical protein
MTELMKYGIGISLLPLRRIMLNRRHRRAHVPKASRDGKKSVKDPVLVGLFDTHPVKRVRIYDYDQPMVSFPSLNPLIKNPTTSKRSQSYFFILL